MVIAVLLAATVAAGAPAPFVAVAALAAWRPVWFLGVAALWGIVARTRQRSDDPATTEAVYLRAVAAELRAGASLRRALADAAGPVPGAGLRRVVRVAASGRPLDEIARLVAPQLPVNGRATAAAIRIGATTGAATAGAFAALALRAEAIADEARERRALTAQARYSALLVGVAPMAFAVLVVTTRFDDFAAAGPVGVGMAGVGMLLDAAGLAVVWAMARKAER